MLAEKVRIKPNRKFDRQQIILNNWLRQQIHAHSSQTNTEIERIPFHLQRKENRLSDLSWKAFSEEAKKAATLGIISNIVLVEH